MATATVDAYGSDVSQRARLVYAIDSSATPDCPDATALRKAVEDRLGYDPFWEWAQRTIVVHVRRDEGKYVTRVVKVDAQGRSVTREIPPDADCRQVIAAAALAISIALDIAPAPAAHPAAPEAPASPAVHSTSPPEPLAAGPEPTPPSAHPPRAPWLAVGGGIATFTGIAPKPGVTAFAFAELRRRAASVAGELQVSTSATVDQLQVALAAVAIVPCLRFDPTFLCGLGEIGWLQVWNTGAASGASGASFVVLGGRGGVEVPLSVQTFLRLQGDLLVEAYGPRFSVPQPAYQTAGLVYRAPSTPLSSSSIGGALGVSMGAYFR